MNILPAIDIRDGNVVRLRQGKYDQETVYFTDPCAVAKMWVREGLILFKAPSVFLKLLSVSDGKPTITSVVIPISGIFKRRYSILFINSKTVYLRFIFFNTWSSPLCKGI